jgi:hypothetical protein
LDTSASDFKDKLYERMLATYKDLCQ